MKTLEMTRRKGRASCQVRSRVIVTSRVPKTFWGNLLLIGCKRDGDVFENVCNKVVSWKKSIKNFTCTSSKFSPVQKVTLLCLRVDQPHIASCRRRCRLPKRCLRRQRLLFRVGKLGTRCQRRTRSRRRWCCRTWCQFQTRRRRRRYLSFPPDTRCTRYP
jgi:hypothetical protein